MRLVLLTALGVGGATVFGTLLGFVFKKVSHRFSDIVLAFAAGVMLAAAVLWPSLWQSAISIPWTQVFLCSPCMRLLKR